MKPVLRVGGFVGFSTVDYPGRLAAVVFCQGCTWRCRYCHNPHLQAFHDGNLAWSEVLTYLRERASLLEAVVFSGGEPTAQPGLAEAMRDVRALGYRVGLHTAGMHPRHLAAVLPLVDWVGLDVKAPLDARMDAITRRPGSARPVRAALDTVRAAGVPCDLRTTIHPALLRTRDRTDLQCDLRQLGLPPSRWQPFRPQGCEDPELTGNAQI